MGTTPGFRFSVVLFDDVELLDVAGPVEVLSKVDDFDVEMLSADGGSVTSSQGVRLGVDGDFSSATGDVLFVPGGMGTRRLVEDDHFLAQLKAMAAGRQILMSVCTGSALLAVAGLLEGYTATSNKRAFDWATSFGENIEWRRSARWVHDRDRWTSSGVAAGTDMAAAFVADRYGEEFVSDIADAIELRLNLDADDDPFAV
ncbi:DJ-1/PfpI family protein [Corynebacterium tuscaniense]|uniref:DJ-1/PfpI family protein n=1 Tax=Corynebacterium tuscaniense TaxID=302449 RepID=A0A2N6T4A8_9CORY|nr:DJ-1/PfpI family protein [Corynebacterium tuscaniense]PMC64142.1 DJ-1/PfpI family protein [Corynebacterium tuscaniense]